MSEDFELEIIVPKGADLSVPLDHALVALTEAIAQLDEDKVAHGFLGGQFGYGGEWDNDVFMMRPFCWCEREDCRWCSDDACGCDHPPCRQYIDGIEVSSDEFWKRNHELLGKMPHDLYKHGTPEYEAYSLEWDEKVKERDRRFSTIFAARVHTCQPRGMMADRPEGDTWKPSQTAPNFWHKASGFRVWWYKYIGRDMEYVNKPSDLNKIFGECMASLTMGTLGKTAEQIKAEKP